MNGVGLRLWAVAYDTPSGPVPVTGFAGVRVTPGAALFLAWPLRLRVRMERAGR